MFIIVSNSLFNMVGFRRFRADFVYVEWNFIGTGIHAFQRDLFFWLRSPFATAYCSGDQGRPCKVVGYDRRHIQDTHLATFLWLGMGAIS